MRRPRRTAGSVVRSRRRCRVCRILRDVNGTGPTVGQPRRLPARRGDPSARTPGAERVPSRTWVDVHAATRTAPDQPTTATAADRPVPAREPRRDHLLRTSTLTTLPGDRVTALTSPPLSTPRPGPAPGTRSPTVLLVDDSPFADEARAALARGWLRRRACRVPTSTPSRPSPGCAPTSSSRPSAGRGPDGFDLLRRLREARPGRTVPVLLLTSGDEQEVLTGLELGADDCVPPTVSGVELAARVRAKTARPAGPRLPGQPRPAHRPALRDAPSSTRPAASSSAASAPAATAGSASSSSRRCPGCSTASAVAPRPRSRPRSPS